MSYIFCHSLFYLSFLYFTYLTLTLVNLLCFSFSFGASSHFLSFFIFTFSPFLSLFISAPSYLLYPRS